MRILVLCGKAGCGVLLSYKKLSGAASDRAKSWRAEKTELLFAAGGTSREKRRKKEKAAKE